MSSAETWCASGSAGFASDPATFAKELSPLALPSCPGPSLASPTASANSAASSPHSPPGAGDCITANADSTKVKAPRGRKPSSFLPNPKSLGKEDDWTRVKDPKEKKRIQNRVAQRTYRSRMKAKLDELQEKLDSHERRKRSRRSSESNDPFRQVEYTAHANPCLVAESLPSPMAGDKPFAHTSVLQQSMYEQALDDSGTPLYGQDFHYLNSPPNSHTSPRPPHGFLSSPPQPDADRSISVSQEFIIDCLRFQTQLLSRLNSLQSSEAVLVAPPPSGADESLAPAAASGSQDVINCTGDFSPSQLDFSFDDPVESWEGCSLEPTAGHPSPLADGLQYHSLPAVPTPLESIVDAGTDMPHLAGADPSSSLSLEERVGDFMQRVKATGFNSFEDLISAYYSYDFAEASFLANEQHLSRNRRLPKLMADMFKATSDWSLWERRGFYEEILKTAESILVTETSSAQGSLLSCLAPLLEAHDGAGLPHSAESLLDIQKLIQQELPNSWAFAMALASENASSWDEDRSKTALAAVLLLQFTGRLPPSQIHEMVGACLGIETTLSAPTDFT